MADSNAATATISSLLEGFEDFNTLEEFAFELARRIIVALLEAIDNALLAAKPKGYKVAGFRLRTISLVLGDITFKRRLYVKATKKKKKGDGRFLLDEALNLRKNKRISGRLLKLAVSLATRLPFRQTADVLKEAGMATLSHMTVHKEVRRTGLEQKQIQDTLKNNLFIKGKEPEGNKKRVPILFLEVDAAVISLQRSNQDRLEIKLGIVYEGWETNGKTRRLKNPHVIIGIFDDADAFWEAFNTEIAKLYELDEDTIMVLNGDGASWIQETAKDHLPGVIIQLDRYHLYRDLRNAFGKKDAQGLIKALNEGQDQVFLDTMESLIENAPNYQNQQQRQKLFNFCQKYRDNLLDYRLRLPKKLEGITLYGMGVAETTVDKKIANRMKKRGMSWSKLGAVAMAALLTLKANGELTTCLDERIPQTEKNPVKVIKEKRINKEDLGQWLRARIPALMGPEAGKPWVKYILKAITSADLATI